jgi:integrase
MKWADVDTSRKEIRLHDKVDGTRFIPLHPYVEQLIFSLTRKGEYIFHGVGQAGHITRPSKAHTAVIEQAGIKPVTLHGFRRTFKNAGRMAGVLQIYVDKAQGHRPKSVSEANYSMITVDELRAPYSKVVDFILKNAGLEQDYRPRVGHLSIMA